MTYQSHFPAFDSHLHLTSAPQFNDEEIAAALTRAHTAKIDSVMNVATDTESLQRSLCISSDEKIRSGVAWYQAAATTPQEAVILDSFFDHVELAARQGLLQAIGETGLDYICADSSKEAQHVCLHRYIELAYQYNLPLIVHCRGAFTDLVSILRNSKKNIKGVLHCFTGSLEEAKDLLELGWYLSISGIITYKKSTEELRKVATYIPSDRLLLETDAPYLAPVPYRGKKNEPALLLYTLEVLAAVRQVPMDELVQITYENGKRLFGQLY